MAELLPVKSSNIDAIGYDPGAAQLHVRFKGRPQVYVYDSVSEVEYRQLIEAQSIGGTFHRIIKLAGKHWHVLNPGS